ncbi:MAG: sarcosine oxidase subunit gamma [Halomonas sp.]|nr:sarcosine oxidase subunit gamma [Halomonas sp.]|tara:strand:+ start:55 stop:723 length:669 start_codon:yes stop_codon:yes gene_type:complete
MSEAIERARTFDAFPPQGIPLESPLAWSFEHVGCPAPGTDSRVVMRERLHDHLILRGGAIVLDEAVRAVLGLSLPARPLELSQGERASLQWLSPDEWLAVLPQGDAFRVETALRSALGDASVAFSDVSAGQTVIELAGDDQALRELLMKSVVYDVHPRHFAVGKGVTTVLAKTSVILRRPDERRWELVVRRSFADYVYRWLLDAGEEFAIGVERDVTAGETT